MRSEELKDFYAELTAAGFEFEGYATRKTGKTHWGRDIVADYGILKEKNGYGIEMERLADVLAFAEKRRVHFVIIPEVRAIRKSGQPKADATPIQPKCEVAACFIHEHASFDFVCSCLKALKLLKQNFLYLQEDERILEWAHLLERTNEEMVNFRKKAYEPENLFENSARIRNYLLNEGYAMRNVNNVILYMEEWVDERVVDSMFNAIDCIRLVSCEGII